MMIPTYLIAADPDVAQVTRSLHIYASQEGRYLVVRRRKTNLAARV